MKEYEQVELKKVYPDQSLPADIFIKIGSKYIRYKYEGDEVTTEKYNHFFSKNLTHMWVVAGNEDKFNKWLEEIKQEKINELVADVGEEYRDIATKREEMKESVFEALASEEITEEMAKNLQIKAEEFVKVTSSKKVPSAVIANLTRNNNSIAEHSVNVANIAIFMSFLLGYENKTLIRNIYLGAIFHDYGKSKIPNDILLDKGHPRYVQSMENHPMRAVEILKNKSGIPPQVMEMVSQHHEMFNGKGYPKGLKGNEISEYAKVLSFANEFDNATLIGPKTKDSYTKAFKLLEYDKGARFDPDMMKILVKGLKKAFGYEEPVEDGIIVT